MSLTPQKRSNLGGEVEHHVDLDKKPKCNSDIIDEDEDDVGDIMSDDDELVPQGALVADYHKFKPYWSRYNRQFDDSNCFDIDDYPGPSMEAPLVPNFSFNTDPKELSLLLELANFAICHYNQKDDNKFKYKFLKIEKVNHMMSKNLDFFMTVKVSNVTLVTPIETFQIHATIVPLKDVKEIRLCQPKVKL